MEPITDLWNLIAQAFQSLFDTSEPTLNLGLNLLILVLVLTWIASRVRAEIRSQQWTSLTPDERRRRIYAICNDAFELAEFLFSHIEPAGDADKKAVAAQKLKTGTAAARADLRAQGASLADLQTVPYVLEKVVADRKPELRRYSSSRMRPDVRYQLPETIKA